MALNYAQIRTVHEQSCPYIGAKVGIGLQFKFKKFRYGDIVPATTTERIFVIFAMGIGTAIFAYGFTKVAEMVSQMNNNQQRFRTLMDDMAAYAKFRNLPPEIRQKMATYIRHRHARTFFKEKVMCPHSFLT